mgnify:FL=1
MSLKSDVLRFLLEAGGDYVSGERMAKEFNVSRMSICKAVQSLTSDDYDIESSKRLGYRINSLDVLSETTLRHFIPFGVGIYFYKETDSTNNRAKEIAISGAETPFVVVAEKQSGGKGRLSRSFSSPKGGLYFSICLSGRDVPDVDLLTTSASLATAKTIEEVTGKDIKIKWVNDLYYNGKKCTGILTEGIVNLEEGGLDKAIIGIGINYETPLSAFPEDLLSIVTSLYPDGDAPITRAEMIAKCVHSVIDIQGKSYLDEYRARCFILGRSLYVLKGGTKREATALSIDDKGHLVVRYLTGEEEALSSGEVSLKL